MKRWASHFDSRRWWTRPGAWEHWAICLPFTNQRLGIGIMRLITPAQAIEEVNAKLKRQGRDK